MARRPKATAGAAEQAEITGGGKVTAAELEKARQQPELHAAVSTLQPYSNTVADIVAGLEVRNETERHVMADLLRQIKTAQGMVADKFDPITKPLWQAWKAARAWQSEVMGPLERAEAAAKQKIGDFERRMLEEKEARDRQARIEAEAARAEAERAAQVAQYNPAPVTNAAFGGVRPVAPPQPTPPPPPSAPSPQTWAPVNTPFDQPAKLSGITTRMEYAVQVTDDGAATRHLIMAGLYDMRQLGVADMFVRLDVSALKIAARRDDEVGQLVREMLARIPGVEVVRQAAVSARGYE